MRETTWARPLDTKAHTTSALPTVAVGECLGEDDEEEGEEEDDDGAGTSSGAAVPSAGAAAPPAEPEGDASEPPAPVAVSSLTGERDGEEAAAFTISSRVRETASAVSGAGASIVVSLAMFPPTPSPPKLTAPHDAATTRTSKKSATVTGGTMG